MQKIYLAGPDVFLKEGIRKTLVPAIKHICRVNGFDPLFPLDNIVERIDIDGNNGRLTKLDHAQRIRAANIAMIKDADIILADISPFRGTGPDAGTIYEVAYANALGKPVILYTCDPRPYLDRCAGDTSYSEVQEGLEDSDGMLVEDFGLVDNLMFAAFCPVVQFFEDAIRLASLAKSHFKDGIWDNEFLKENLAG